MAQSTTVIPADVIRELQQHITNNQPKAAGPDDVRQGFCSSWPAARVGLEGLQTVLSLVPGVAMFASPAIWSCWLQATPPRELCAKRVDTDIGQRQSARRTSRRVIDSPQRLILMRTGEA
jgi:hypothetical protein